MNDYKIVTDVNSDLPMDYYKDNDIKIFYLSYSLDGETYYKDKFQDYREFYNLMREGKMPTTTQANPADAREIFEEVLEETNNIICISFSSGLSGTCNSATLAARELMEERSDCNIKVVDSLSASLGEGLLLHKAVSMKKEGKSMDEVVDWLENNKLNIVHIFTVDDLMHLYRGGRVSKASAVIGSMVAIKPILHVDNEGRLIPIAKVRGRKKSLTALADYMDKHIGSYRNCNDVVFISHGDCEEEAIELSEDIKKRFGINNFMINNIGPVIGAHSGPGTMALFFMGDER